MIGRDVSRQFGTVRDLWRQSETVSRQQWQRGSMVSSRRQPKTPVEEHKGCRAVARLSLLFFCFFLALVRRAIQRLCPAIARREFYLDSRCSEMLLQPLLN